MAFVDVLTHDYILRPKGRGIDPREIERDQIYKKLSLQRKEDLLSQIAFTTFERSEHFFKQNVIEQFIINYIHNFADANTDPDALQLDGEAILKSIEAQHGLLVERARGIYSFSHLTFQEYFTAKKIVSSSPAKALELQQSLLNRLTEFRWREVILLTISMIQDADDLITQIKQRVDNLVTHDKRLQKLLSWIDQKATKTSTETFAATRAFYLSITLAILLVRNRACTGTAVKLRSSGEVALQLDGTLALGLAHALQLKIDRRRDLGLLLDYSLAYALVVGQILVFSPEHNNSHTASLCDVLRDRLDSAVDCTQNINLQKVLEKLRAEIDFQKNHESQTEWWGTAGLYWVDQLKAVISDYCSLRLDWNLTESQINLLLQYYHANKLLVDCINSDCYITRPVREGVRATLLLPTKTEVEG